MAIGTPLHPGAVLDGEERAEREPARELASRAIESARDLVGEELALAVLEVREEARAVERAAAFGIVATVLSAVALAWAGLALALAAGMGPLAVLGMTGAAAVLAAACGALAWKALPDGILTKSKRRIEHRLKRMEKSLR